MNFKILFFFILLINFSFEFHREKIESKYTFISKKNQKFIHLLKYYILYIIITNFIFLLLFRYVKELNETNFNDFINNNPQVYIMFYSPWCHICKNAKPLFFECIIYFLI